MYDEFGLSPSPGNDCITKFALITGKVIDGNLISDSLNKQLFTMMTIGVVYFRIDYIAYINITNSRGHGQLAKLDQSRKRSGR